MLFKCSIAFDMGMKIGHRPSNLTWTWLPISPFETTWNVHTKSDYFVVWFFPPLFSFLFLPLKMFFWMSKGSFFLSSFFFILIFEYDHVTYVETKNYAKWDKSYCFTPSFSFVSSLRLSLSERGTLSPASFCLFLFSAALYSIPRTLLRSSNFVNCDINK